MLSVLGFKWFCHGPDVLKDTHKKNKTQKGAPSINLHQPWQFISCSYFNTRAAGPIILQRVSSSMALTFLWQVQKKKKKKEKNPCVYIQTYDPNTGQIYFFGYADLGCHVTVFPFSVSLKIIQSNTIWSRELFIIAIPFSFVYCNTTCTVHTRSPNLMFFFFLCYCVMAFAIDHNW